MNWIRKNAVTTVLVAMLVVGAGLIAYPSFSDWWNSFHQSRAVASYAESVSRMNTEEYEKLIVRAENYNKKLSKSGILWTMSEEETAEYWKQRAYFEKVLPVPPFYEQGNPDHAVTWFKDTPQGQDIWNQLTFYRRMCSKYGIKLYKTECATFPGEIIYEDDFQIAVINEPEDQELIVTEI